MSTFIGIISGFTLLFMAIFSQGGFMVFVNKNAFMITMGGTIAATFISFPLPRVMSVTKVLINIFKQDIQKPSTYIGRVVNLAFQARKESLLSLDKETKKIRNRFLRKGIEMIVDGTPPEMIKEVLETEMNFLNTRHMAGEHIFRTAGKYAPAFGLIGTLIGLIAMLRGLGGASDANTLGPAMAVALVTTFYGAMLANLFLIPVAEKLRSRTDEEILQIQIITEGILMIQSGTNPRIIEQKLNSFLPPYMRTSYYREMLRKHKDLVEK